MNSIRTAVFQELRRPGHEKALAPAGDMYRFRLPGMHFRPVEEIFVRWPQLQSAIQPPQVPTETGGTVLRSWKHDFKTFTLRRPAISGEGLVGPWHGRGRCLEPFLMSGDYSWIDPTIEPAAGDFVMVIWHPEFFQRIAALREEYSAENGRDPSGIACKRLALVDGKWLLTTVGDRGITAAIPLEGNASVLGVVRYVERDGVPVHLATRPR